MRRLSPRKFLPPSSHLHPHRPPSRQGPPEVSAPSPPTISRVAAPSTPIHHRPRPRPRQGSTQLLRFRITLAPQGVSRKVLELVKHASASKHLLRGGTTIQSLLSTLPPAGGRNGDVGPVVLALSCASVVAHVPIIRECNRLGVPWVYVPDSLEGEGGVVGRTGVGAVMVVPWVVGVGVGEGGWRQRQEEGGGVQVGEGARAVAKEFDFRDARRVVVGLLAGVRDLDCEGESSDFP